MYVGKDGITHFDDVEIVLDETISVGKKSKNSPSFNLFFYETSAEYNKSLMTRHSPSLPLLLVHSSGRVRIQAGDGESRVFSPGSLHSSACFMEAVGVGHVSEVLEGTVEVLVIALAAGEFAVKK